MIDETATAQEAPAATADAVSSFSAPIAEVATEAPPAVAPPATDAAVDAWFVESFYNSPVSRDTAVFNCVRSAVDDLKTRLAKL